MERQDEEILIAFIKAQSSNQHELASVLASNLRKRARRSSDRRFLVCVDHLVNGKSLTETARQRAYTRAGVKTIIRCYRKKAKN